MCSLAMMARPRHQQNYRATVRRATASAPSHGLGEHLSATFVVKETRERPKMIHRRAVLSAAAVLPLRPARAQASQTIRIGALTDLNGPNSASSGPGSVVSTQLAAEDFMAAHPGTKVEVLSADYQSKPDI